MIPKNLVNFPSLYSSYKIGKKSKKIKFDWDNAEQVVEKVKEELDEFLESYEQKNQNKINEEFGDLLFTLAQLGRHLDLDPEESLRLANKKFLNRFHKMESIIKESQKDILEMDQKEMDIYWDKVKANEKK